LTAHLEWMFLISKFYLGKMCTSVTNELREGCSRSTYRLLCLYGS